MNGIEAVSASATHQPADARSSCSRTLTERGASATLDALVGRGQRLRHQAGERRQHRGEPAERPRPADPEAEGSVGARRPAPDRRDAAGAARRRAGRALPAPRPQPVPARPRPAPAAPRVQPRTAPPSRCWRSAARPVAPTRWPRCCRALPATCRSRCDRAAHAAAVHQAAGRSGSTTSQAPCPEAVEGEPVAPRPGADRARAATTSRSSSRAPCGRAARPRTPPENFCRPAVDVLFRSASAIYGERCSPWC